MIIIDVGVTHSIVIMWRIVIFICISLIKV